MFTIWDLEAEMAPLPVPHSQEKKERSRQGDDTEQRSAVNGRLRGDRLAAESGAPPTETPPAHGVIPEFAKKEGMLHFRWSAKGGK
ncbi:hypothetical protein AAFF_G00288780 [Aldrovandia affinis]|uniref:Uncharacterized protein n=1 Tax=Aldrovandia affinis TaxID=143900 RepID=A0AAD7WS35_9TELE|nr:hypothetical protein AAFF_G00288780 [Aldrovandia affinis]